MLYLGTILAKFVSILIYEKNPPKTIPLGRLHFKIHLPEGQTTMRNDML